MGVRSQADSSGRRGRNLKASTPDHQQHFRLPILHECDIPKVATGDKGLLRVSTVRIALNKQVWKWAIGHWHMRTNQYAAQCCNQTRYAAAPHLNCHASPDTAWGNGFKIVEKLVGDRTHEASQPELARYASESPQKMAHITSGLLYGMLAKPELAKYFMQHLSSITKDNFQHAVSLLKPLTLQKAPKLLIGAAVQVVWVTEQLIKVSCLPWE